MKKRYFSILLSIFLGLHLCSVDILAQTCTQLSLPENAIARMCLQEGGTAIDLDFSPDGKTLASVINGKVVLWDIEKKTEKLTINNINGRYVKYSSNGKTLVCGDVLYDAITGEPTLLLLDGEGYRDYVLFSPDGKILAGAGPKGIRFWKATIEEAPEGALPVDEQPINVLPTDPSTVIVDDPETSPTSVPFATSSTTVTGIKGLSYSPDGKELAVACRLGIWIYNTEQNTEVVLLKNRDDQVFSVSYSPDGNILVAGDHHNIYLHDTKTKELKFKFSRNFFIVYSLIFQDNNTLISCDAHGIYFLDITTFEYKRILSKDRFNFNMSISPNGNILSASANDRSILLFDLTSYPNYKYFTRFCYISNYWRRISI